MCNDIKNLAVEPFLQSNVWVPFVELTPFAGGLAHLTGGISEICSLSEFATVGRHITEESGVATKVEAVSDDDPDPSDELSVSDVDDVGGARNWPFSASSPSESVPMPHNAARGLGVSRASGAMKGDSGSSSVLCSDTSVPCLSSGPAHGVG